MIYCIEGNIGAGKSTLIKLFETRYTCYEEPINEWTLLDRFYEDPHKFAFPFQYQVLLSQYNQYRIIKNESKDVFIERCAWSSRNIFIELMKKNNFWNDNDTKYYDNLYNSFEQGFINTLFFLDVSPEECLKRIKIRNRTCETDISLKYLIDLDKQYRKSLQNFPARVVFIDVANKTPEEIRDEIETYTKN